MSTGHDMPNTVERTEKNAPTTIPQAFIFCDMQPMESSHLPCCYLSPALPTLSWGSPSFRGNTAKNYRQVGTLKLIQT